jgi:hypothetical protein
MKVRNRHERIVAAPPEQIAALIADFDRVWPTELAPAPRLQGHHLYDAGLMLWEEFDRPGATRAFRMVRPDELQAEHWFELELAPFSAHGALCLLSGVPQDRQVRVCAGRRLHVRKARLAEGATVLRHTVEGCAVGKYEAIWCEQIEPLHDLILEALLDNVEAAVASND